MGRPVFVLIVLVLALILGGMAYLMFADVPAPAGTIEQTVPDDQLARG